MATERPEADAAPAGHPSQAEGEDPRDAPATPDDKAAGHPSQAEGDDPAHPTDAATSADAVS